MAKYNVKVGEWITPSETSGSIQNTSMNIPIEVTSSGKENTGLLLEPLQIINFEGTVFVRSTGNQVASFTTVPFKIAAGGGGGGGSTPYELPTASASVKGGIKVGNNLEINNEILSAINQITDWENSKSYKVGDIVVRDNKFYKCITAHISTNFSEDLSKWEVFTSNIKNWTTSKFYDIGSMVLYSGNLYICANAHTSSSSFDVTKFVNVSGQKNTKVEEWTIDTFYELNQLVVYNNNLFRCANQHKSESTFSADSDDWELMYASLGTWKSSCYYDIGYVVVYDNKLYQCITAHTSDISFDDTKWSEIVCTQSYQVPDWKANEEYKINDVVFYGQNVYRCLLAHSSVNFNSSKWEKVSSDIGEWHFKVFYARDAIVTYGDNIYRCSGDHVSGESFDDKEWDIISNKFFINSWVTGNEYNVGNIVVYGDVLYRCNISHTSSVFSTDSSNWDVIFGYIPSWKSGIYYKIGMVILYNDTLYVCKTNHTSGVSFDILYWEQLGKTACVLENWISDKLYTINSFVYFNGSIFRCITEHTSGTFITDINNWELITSDLKVWATNKYYTEGNTVIYDNLLYRCSTSHTSGVTFDGSNWSMVGGEPVNVAINPWQSGILYSVNDIVIYNGHLFTCIGVHTSSASFGFDVEYWAVDNGVKNWQANTLYFANQFVYYDELLYIVSSTFTSSTTFDDTNLILVKPPISLQYGNLLESKSDGLFVERQIAQILDWETNKQYEVGDIVYCSKSIYRCETAHLSDTFIDDIDNWVLIYTDIKLWESSTQYIVGNIVINNNKLYRCITNHISGATFSVGANWVEIGTCDTAYLLNWTSSQYYTIGELVFYAGSIYRCTVAHTSTVFVDDKDYWELVVSDLKSWQSNRFYIQGVCCIYNNKIYICNAVHTSTSSFDDTKWTLLSGGSQGSGISDWQSGISYNVGDLVIVNISIYRCITSHTSSSDFILDIANWQQLRGTQYEYSTTEKLAGTWLNSSAVYQKTYSTYAPSAIGTFIKLFDLVDVDKIIDIKVVSEREIIDSTPPDINDISEVNPVKIVAYNGALWAKIFDSSQISMMLYITIQYTKA